MTIAETKRDIGLIAVCGTGTLLRTRPPELQIVQLKAEELAEMLHPDIPNRMTIGTHNLHPGMNSSNTTSAEHVSPFARQVFNELQHRYRALVLVFGTNTGADFGTALALTQGRGLKIPIIIVSGQRHHGREGSDSMHNIEQAVRAAKAASEQQVAEVMIFSGEAGATVLRAVTSLKASDNNLEIYRSFNTPPLAELPAHDIFFKDHAHKVDSTEPELHAEFKGEVVVFRLHMDLNPKYLSMVAKKGVNDKRGCDFLILDTYETGNVPDRFLSVIEQLVKNGTRVIVVPYFSEPNLTFRMPREEQNAVQAGAITAPGNMTKPALVAKARQLNAHPELVTRNQGTFEQALNTDFVGEIPKI